METRAAVRRRAAGSSLIEAVVAIALLGVALLSAAGLLTAGNRQVDRSGQRSQALGVAQAILEQLRVGPFGGLTTRLGCDDSLPACGVDTGQPTLADWQALASAELPAARVDVAVDAVGAATLASAPALRLSVRVRWGGGRHPREVRLSMVRG